MWVGSIVRLKKECLGNPAGTTGICYEVYELGGREGHSFIFENGRYDGFSPKEVDMFLEELGSYMPFEGYQFKNVIQLTEDFRRGVFDEAFSEAQLLNT